jgi:hypothetical protein
VVWWCTAAMIAGGLVLNAVNQRSNAGLSAPIGHDIVFSLWAAAYAIVGALITIRRPGNAVGWLLLGAGVVFALGSLLYEYANSALGPRPAPGGMIALVLANTLPTAALSLIAVALLLFPNGHLPGPRWRPVAWLSLASIVFLNVGYGLTPGRIDPAAATDNPLGIGGAAIPLDGLLVLGWSLTVLGFAAAGIAATRRLRLSTGVARQQMKWVTYAAAILGVIWAPYAGTHPLPLPSTVAAAELAAAAAAMVGIPAAMGIAILRYRLFEIDLIIRKTIVYALLISVLFVIYAGGVFVFSQALGRVAGGTSALVVTLSTLAVAAAFQPLRHRIQHAVDHRFYRDKYDPTQILSAFNNCMREEIDIDALATEMIAVVTDTLQPSHAMLWVRPADPP